MFTRYFLIISAFCMTSICKGQGFEAALEKYGSSIPEKLYIHFDQEFYVPGETIWFKAYLYKDGKPVENNTNLYVQLLDPLGKPVVTQVYPVLGAVTKGGIILNDSLKNGLYRVRAMTTPMINSGRGHYSKSIRISKSSATTALPAIQLNFFPESGQLVSGILSRVAFVAEDENGKPVNIKGTLREAGGNTITQFSTYHNGLGKLQFRPRAGKSYEAELDWQGEKKIFKLPAVQESGINLRVDAEKDGKAFKLSRIVKSPGQYDLIYLVAEINDHVVYEQEIAFEDYPSVQGHLLTAELPSGILHFTVFDKDKKVIAERLSFINNEEYRSSPEISISKSSASPRAEQKIILKFTGENDFSGSVLVTQDTGAVKENIISYLLLTSRLSRRVWDASRYFSSATDSSWESLDLLLISQKLSGFDWNEVLAYASPDEPGVKSNFISVTGKVMDDRKAENLGPGKLNIYIEAEDSSSINYEAGVADDGRFVLDSILFYGKAKFYYAYSDKHGRQRAAKIIADEDPRLVKLQGLAFTPGEHIEYAQGSSQDLKLRLEQVGHHDDQVRILERVTLRVKHKRPTDLLEEKYTTGVFKTQSKVTIDNVNYPAKDISMSVVDFIRNRINQVELTGRGFVNRKTLSMGTATRWPVGIFLDESPADLSALRTLRVGDVALVKFYDAGWVGVGTLFPGGGLAVYTKDHSESEFKPEKLEFINVQGFTLVSPFLHIDYGQKDVKHAATDYRHILYWNPDLVISKGSTEYNFSFYNNDLRGPRKLIVEGFDSNGRLVYEEKILE